MRGPYPLFHATSALPVAGMPEGWTARALHLRGRDGTVSTVASVINYQREHSSRSTTWQDTAVRGLGLLWDFSIVMGASICDRATREERNPQKMLYREFALALRVGTIRTGSDPSGLYWPPTPLGRAKTLLAGIEEFAEWYHEEYSEHRSNLVPQEVPDEPLTFADYIMWGRIRHVSLLAHLRKTPARVKRERVVDLGPSTSGAGAEPVKFFPPAHVEHLLWQGYARPHCHDSTNPFLTYNVRDQLILLLDAWGGLRHSEPLHLWVQDVVEEPGKPGHALVVLNHPSEAMVEYPYLVRDQKKRASREIALMDLYGLKPRHSVKRSAYHVGWKGMDLNENHQAFVYWLDDTAASLFWTLYLGYLRYIRTPIMAQRLSRGGYNHPFLFVSEVDPRGGHTEGMIGDPYSSKAHGRNQQAAVERIRLPYGKSHGTTTQGMRHLYGQTLMNLGVPAQVIKKGLHHRHFLSQVPYTVPSRQETNAQLSAARARQKGEDLNIPPLGHDSSRALLQLHQYITAGGKVEWAT